MHLKYYRVLQNLNPSNITMIAFCTEKWVIGVLRARILRHPRLPPRQTGVAVREDLLAHRPRVRSSSGSSNHGPLSTS